MEQIRLGTSGLEVSRLCLGCMGFGEPERGTFLWSLSLDDALPVFRRALDAGITFFDTANVYSAGRSRQDASRATFYGEDDRRVVDAVGEVADRHGVARAQVSLGWLLSRPGVASPIIGATRPEQLDDTVAALELRLTDDDVTTLEAGYRPRAVAGH